MSKGRKTRILIIVLVSILLITIMLFTTLPESGRNALTAPFSAVFKKVELFFGSVRDGIGDYFKTASNNRELRSEIRDLEEQNVRLRLQIKENEVGAREYERLKNAFNLQRQFDYADIEAARILEYPQAPGFDLYRIDKSSELIGNHGLGQGFAVVDSEAHLFGRIYNTDGVTSKVLPLTHEGFSAVVRVDGENTSPFTLRGDIKWKDQGLCLAEDISEDVSLTAGSVIVTSGQGGIFPHGIEVGTVEKVLAPNTLGRRSALIRPSIDFSETSVVFILMGQPDMPVDEADNPDKSDTGGDNR